jgi:hypothetical protein
VTARQWRAAAAGIGFGMALLIGAQPAWPCGSSGGGGSSSHGGGGGGGGAVDVESDPPCAQTTPIVGRSECSRFGAWDVGWLPPIELGLGASVRRFSLDGMHFEGVAQHDRAVAFNLRGADLGAGDVTAVTSDLRMLTGLGRHLYLGLEGELGGVAVDGDTMQRATQTLTPGNALFLGGGGFVGVRTGGRGLRLRAELYGGVRALIEEVESHDGICTSPTSMRAVAPAIEPRLALETWLTPYATLGANFGANALAERDYSVGLLLSMHARAFDGADIR